MNHDREEKTAEIIHIFTKEPWVPELPIEQINEAGEEGIDNEAIRATEMMLEDLRAGRCVGVALMTWHKEQQSFFYASHLPPRVQTTQGAFMFLGGLEELRSSFHDLASLSAFGGEDPSKIMVSYAGEEDDEP